ncbi:MAG: DNA sulfur modification protein DndB [Ardenticatenaceae bacterium]|nr:DNA sulfur modification protein DndB [Ardenticatenaceae bacterium]
MSYGYTYTFPALRGIQAGREYYVAMCPLKLLPRIFLFDEAPIPPELRAQRTLNTARVPEITRYIVENRHDYAFSAITASIDGEVRFEPAMAGDENSDIGHLVVSMLARFVINDGQHRRAAIEAALEQYPELGDETIAVVFYLDEGLRRSQQLFADLNKHAVRPTKSIGVLYDYRDPLASLSRELAERVFYFKGLTEMEKTTISNRSIKLFTLSAIYQATGALLEKSGQAAISQQERELTVRFWNELGEVILEWRLAAERKVRSSELRANFVHVHSVVLHALGLAGATLIRQHPDDWSERLCVLRQLDWSRSKTVTWEGRAMTGGQMSKTRQNLQLTANFLKITLGLSLSPEEERLEESYRAGAFGKPRKTTKHSKRHPTPGTKRKK